MDKEHENMKNIHGAWSMHATYMYIPRHCHQIMCDRALRVWCVESLWQIETQMRLNLVVTNKQQPNNIII